MSSVVEQSQETGQHLMTWLKRLFTDFLEIGKVYVNIVWDKIDCIVNQMVWGTFLGGEADYSIPFTTETKNLWNYTSTAPYVSIKRSLIKGRGNFTFYRTSGQDFSTTWILTNTYSVM